ncbi:MAG: HDOD domain-containing protein [candidate division Zixibacteria bacterium]|nr:HDOD domain-containing protein [candidate division Zixibacteria bacterium]
MEKLEESSRSLDIIISSIGELPAIPVIIASLMNLTSDLNTDINKITKALLADQSLTARVLKLSNSSFYGRAKEVKTLKEAIVLLGFNTLRSLVVATSTHSLYDSTGGENHNKLWEHTLASAISCRLVAKFSRHLLVEEAFIAGLLHDIGKLVLLQKKPDEYTEIIVKVEMTQGQFIDFEEEKFGFNHTDIGLLLLHKWSFPKVLSNAVFEHHSPIDLEDSNMPLAFVINLGNMLAKKLDIGFNDYNPENLAETSSAVKLGLTEEALAEIEEQLAEQFKYERDVFIST